MPLPEDLDQIDTAIRQLQVKWDLFFSGAEKKPPLELQAKVEALIKRNANMEIRNNADRFRYQGLTARYVSFNELWQKRLRAREEGKAFGVHGLRAEQAPASASRVPQSPKEPRAAAEFRIADSQRDQDSIRALYQSFVEARRRGGEGDAPAYDSFRQLIAQQTERLRSEKGARAVDFRLETKEGKTSLKARIVK